VPIGVNGTVPPRRLVNLKRRPREYLNVKEVELLMETARKRGRHGHRDATMILVAFRHGLRPSEVCALRWDMVDLSRGLMHVRRLKNGTPSVQPIGGIELRALRKLKREEIESRFVFMTGRAAPMTTAGYRKMMSRTGESAEFPFPVHPHMLRHACGYTRTVLVGGRLQRSVPAPALLLSCGERSLLLPMQHRDIFCFLEPE
jgi:integrase